MVTKIGDSAFSDCIGLKDVILEKGITLFIGSNVFCNCPISSLYLGRNIDSYISVGACSLTPFMDKKTLTTIIVR
jgi:hypothetical protein